MRSQNLKVKIIALTFQNRKGPNVTFKDIPHFMKYWCLHKASIHRNLYQDWLINQCA